MAAVIFAILGLEELTGLSTTRSSKPFPLLTAQVFNNVFIYGEASIDGNAKVANNSEYIVFKNWWSSGRYFTWTRSDNMWRVGCFYGTSEELIEKAYNDSELSGREYERVVKYVESILKDYKYDKKKRNN